MPNNIASQALGPGDLSYLVSSEAVGILTTQVLSESSDTASADLKKELDIQLGRLAKANILSDLISEILAFSGAEIRKVSVDSLANVAKTPDALRALFNADGERIGVTLQDSQAAINGLKELGISLQGNAQVPCLQQTYSKDNKLISQEIVWLSPEKRDEMVGLYGGKPSTEFPDTTELTYKAGDNTIKIKLFDGSINIRIPDGALGAVVSSVSQIYQTMLEDFNAALEKISDQSKNIDAARESIKNITSNYKNFIREDSELLRDQINEIRKTYLILRKEQKRIEDLSDRKNDPVSMANSELKDSSSTPFRVDAASEVSDFMLAEKYSAKIPDVSSLEKKSQNISDKPDKIHSKEKSDIPLDWKMRAFRNLQEV